MEGSVVRREKLAEKDQESEIELESVKFVTSKELTRRVKPYPSSDLLFERSSAQG